MKHSRKAARFVTTILSALELCVWGLSGFLCLLRHLTVWAVQNAMAAMLPKKMICKVLNRPAFSHVLLEKLWKQDEMLWPLPCSWKVETVPTEVPRQMRAQTRAAFLMDLRVRAMKGKQMAMNRSTQMHREMRMLPYMFTK